MHTKINTQDFCILQNNSIQRDQALRAARQLAKLPKPEQQHISAAARQLALWPDCRNVKALANRRDYRLRVGRYRVIFTVDTRQIPTIVFIEEVKKRDEHTY